jgi:phosphoenolpyruvate-protein kinase (PTS system EI component)
LEIYEAHIEILNDPELISKTIQSIERRAGLPILPYIK